MKQYHGNEGISRTGLLRLGSHWLSILDSILSLGRRDGLPLHVAGRVGAAMLQRLDVVDHVAGARTRRSSRGLAGYDRWKACFASGLRLIFPWLSRAQVAHFDFE